MLPPLLRENGKLLDLPRDAPHQDLPAACTTQPPLLRTQLPPDLQRARAFWWCRQVLRQSTTPGPKVRLLPSTSLANPFRTRSNTSLWSPCLRTPIQLRMQPLSTTRSSLPSRTSSAIGTFSFPTWSTRLQALSPTTLPRQHPTARCSAHLTSHLLPHTQQTPWHSNFSRQLLPLHHQPLFLQRLCHPHHWSMVKLRSWDLQLLFHRQLIRQMPCWTQPFWLNRASPQTCARHSTFYAWTWIPCRLPCAETFAT